MREIKLDENLRIMIYENDIKTGYITSQSVRDNLLFKQLELLTEINEKMDGIHKFLRISSKQ